MAKAPQYPKVYKGPLPKGNDEGGRFVARDLAKIDPKKEQFAPTEAEPVRQRYRMGGGC